MRAGRTHVALNGYSTPTAAFVKNSGWQNPSEACVADIGNAIGAQAHAGKLGVFDANAVATQLMGDTIFINPMILGYAWQKGWVPLGREALLRAIELNEVAVEQNKQAFEWGRQCAHDWLRVEALLKPAQVIAFKKRSSLEDLVKRRVAYLTDYQNAAYAEDYRALVSRVQQAEAALGKTTLSESVARNLFKLMAYKDEYEVARLHADPAFQQRIREQFEGDFQLKFHLAPPLLAKTNEKGELVKQSYGPWMLSVFGLLAKFKGLRGTALDVFGKTEERRMERALIVQYRQSLEEVLKSLNASNHALAIDIAQLPEQIKGYGHVKARNAAAAQSQWARLMGQWRDPSQQAKAA
jgi:indolepyruvate ferredoxin oxidoreductase